MAYAYDIFISYTQRDGEIAANLASRLHDADIRCFMADRSILAAAEWEPTLRDAIHFSERVLLLMTPRSKASLWVAAEAGAAWVLQKELIPILMFVDPGELFEPIRKFQARIVETPQQLDELIIELQRLTGRTSRGTFESTAGEPGEHLRELFSAPSNWERLVKVGQWTLDEATGSITGEGMYRYLLSDHNYGIPPFTIHARLQFLELRPVSTVDTVNAGIVLGWNTPSKKPRYLHLMFSGKRLLLEQIGQRGEDEYHDFRHIDEGVPFPLHARQTYDLIIKAASDLITVSCDGHTVYSVQPPQETLLGKVGLRPWRSYLRCERFEVVSR